MNLEDCKVALVGPLPPPAGGMANQTRQLGELLQREGTEVTIVQVNAPYRPDWIRHFRGVRALFRLVPYVVRLWRASGKVHLLHIMANSGWAWHLCATPAIWVAWLRGRPSVVNYRGGEAGTFLARSSRIVRRNMQLASALVVPSAFLKDVFARHGIRAEIVANIVDLERFRPADRGHWHSSSRVVIARNLEAIYDIPTALRAFSIILGQTPAAKLIVAGSGPDFRQLVALAAKLGISEAVEFCGRLERDQMADLYRSAAVALNPSRADNMPNSVLEAMASGVPVVSTNVGGVPLVIRDGVTGLLVEAGDHAAMAAAVERLLCDEQLAKGLRDAALVEVQRYAWPRIRRRWAEVYKSALDGARVEVRPA